MIVGLLVSCEKDYYDPIDIEYTVITPDTIYLDSAITIKGSINQPLDIRIYWKDLSDENLIGILKPHEDSISWTPSNIEEGNYVFCMVVHFKTDIHSGSGITGFQGVVVKKKPNSRSKFLRFQTTDYSTK